MYIAGFIKLQSLGMDWSHKLQSSSVHASSASMSNAIV